MQRCPECRRDYYDDTLLYCLNDGTALLEGPASMDEPATELFGETPRAILLETRREAGVETSDRLLDKRLLLVPVVLAMILGGFFGYRYFLRPGGEQIESIEVMPFANTTGNGELDYLSEGMTDSLIGILSQLPGLRVKAQSSVFRYSGKDVGAQTLGRELGVQTVLNGRVVQRGDVLSIGVELIDTTGENVISVRQYDRKPSELVSLQNEIGRHVADKLQKKLSGTDQQRLEKRPTENTDAFRQYLLGRYEWNKCRKESLLEAVEHFKRAIETRVILS